MRDLADYLWDLPLARSPEEFSRWFGRAETLAIHAGTGLPEPVLAELAAAGFDASLFRRLLEHTESIVSGSFYGVADNAGSLGNLEAVLAIAANLGVAPPPASRFGDSLFRDRLGWGRHMTPAERDAWRGREE